MRLYLLGFLCVLSGISLILLIIALTDIYPVQKLSDNRSVIGLVFLMFGGFTRKAYQRYKE